MATAGNGQEAGTLLLTMLFLNDPKRAKHFAAMVLIGDGVMAIVNPRNDARAWKTGPKLWHSLMGKRSERPGLTRVIGVAQVIGGICWALHQDEAD